MFNRFSLERQFSETFLKKEEYRTRFINRCHELDISNFSQPLSDSTYLSDKKYKHWLQDEVNRLYVKLDYLALEISKQALEEKSILKEATNSMLMYQSE